MNFPINSISDDLEVTVTVFEIDIQWIDNCFSHNGADQQRKDVLRIDSANGDYVARSHTDFHQILRSCCGSAEHFGSREP